MWQYQIYMVLILSTRIAYNVVTCIAVACNSIRKQQQQLSFATLSETIKKPLSIGIPKSIQIQPVPNDSFITAREHKTESAKKKTKFLSEPKCEKIISNLFIAHRFCYTHFLKESPIVSINVSMSFRFRAFKNAITVQPIDFFFVWFSIWYDGKNSFVSIFLYSFLFNPSECNWA